MSTPDRIYPEICVGCGCVPRLDVMHDDREPNDGAPEYAYVCDRCNVFGTFQWDTDYAARTWNRANHAKLCEKQPTP